MLSSFSVTRKNFSNKKGVCYQTSEGLVAKLMQNMKVFIIVYGDVVTIILYILYYINYIILYYIILYIILIVTIDIGFSNSICKNTACGLVTIAFFVTKREKMKG